MKKPKRISWLTYLLKMRDKLKPTHATVIHRDGRIERVK